MVISGGRAFGEGATVAVERGSVRVSPNVSEADWNAYVSSHRDATADHLWRWREIFTGVFGHDSVYLVARRGNTMVGVLPLVLFRSRIFGRSVISLPFLNYGGVLADDEDAARALIENGSVVAREFGASHVELRHRTQMFPALPTRQHKLGLTRPLPAAVDELWKDIDRKVRNQVRKAQKEGLVAAEGGADLVHEFYPVFARNMRDLGTPVYPRALFESTLRAFPDRARVFVVRQGSQTVAAAISISFRDTALVPWASSLRAFRHLCPNMLLYWTMMERAILDGVSVFDFGRSSPDSGTHAFKLQWGGQPEPLHWEYLLFSRRTVPDQGPSSPRFLAAVRIWSRLPLAIANAFGPMIVRSIP
jgi:FemAB-related protein (PEP-CTERM system-associated)